MREKMLLRAASLDHTQHHIHVEFRTPHQVMSSAILTEPAMVEALTIVTEAKSAALQETGIRSPVSNKIATGTGTDSIAVVCGHGPEKVRYCGKHVLFGEILGRLVTDAVISSIDRDF